MEPAGFKGNIFVEGPLDGVHGAMRVISPLASSAKERQRLAAEAAGKLKLEQERKQAAKDQKRACQEKITIPK